MRKTMNEYRHHVSAFFAHCDETESALFRLVEQALPGERMQIYSTGSIEFKRRILAADAILFAAPEHNYSVSGTLENAIDWASRLFAKSAWTGKPAAPKGASPAVRARLARNTICAKTWSPSGVSGNHDQQCRPALSTRTPD